MLRRWAGPLVTALIVGGVALIVVLNLDLKRSSTRAGLLERASPPPPQARPRGRPSPRASASIPIGDPIEKNQMRVAAVWLPPIQMDGMVDPSAPT